VFKNWFDPSSSSATGSVMVVHGSAGRGKSVLRSFIFDTLERGQPTSREITVLFSFSVSDANRKTLNSLLCTFWSQLLEQDNDGILFPLFEGFMVKATPSTSDILKSLDEAVKLLSCPIRSIIDGVDECSGSGHNIHNCLLDISRKRPNFHVVLLSQCQAFAPDLLYFQMHLPQLSV
jgi:hypothetical protein